MHWKTDERHMKVIKQVDGCFASEAMRQFNMVF
jgi:hypothetical protein